MRFARSTIATLLATLFSFSLIAPLLLADSGSTLPACCRRDGKHHCAMMEADDDESPAQGISAVRGKCPSFPKGGATAASAKILVSPSSFAITAPPIAHRAIQSRNDAHSRLTLDRSEQKRGPPSLHTS